MRHLTRSIFIFLIVLSFSCGPSPSEKNQQLRDEVIAVHDEVMPLMGKLKSLEKEAATAAEELEASGSEDTTKIEELKALAFDLNQAYEGMFVWMRQYETEDGELTPEEVKAYLDDQMIKVSVVNEDIKAALEKAEELLKD